MKTLFIDTHSEKVTIILDTGVEKFRGEALSDRSHSETVIPLLNELLEKADLSSKDLEQIIVVNGPGSFTGVRIGVTIAKTIAYLVNIPIKSISSLEMFGVSATEDFDLVGVSDSKGVYSALFKDGEFCDFQYQKRSIFEEMVKSENLKVLESKTIDLDKIYKYLETKNSENPHLVNPIYIKEIDALK